MSPAAHASTAPAVPPATREWRGFSFFEDIVRRRVVLGLLRVGRLPGIGEANNTS